MPRGLIRHHGNGDFHFITFSCEGRLPYLRSEQARIKFEESLERTRRKYKFLIFAYVAMPEHVHLLMSEPEVGTLPNAMKMLKLASAAGRKEIPFWLPRYHDFNVFTEKKRVEKLQYVHWNPVKRGLVDSPEKWVGPSYHHWWTGVDGRVVVESAWLGNRRERALLKPEAVAESEG